MTITTSNNEMTIDELGSVAGGMPFYGMECSTNQQELIGAIGAAAASVPVIGGFLESLVTDVGRGLCHGK